MGAIDIGAYTSRGGTGFTTNTLYTDFSNSANASGVLNSFQCWFETNATGVKIGTFSGNSTTLTYRDHVNVGDVASGSLQTFTGDICDVAAGDYISIYAATGLASCQMGNGVALSQLATGDKMTAGSYNTVSYWGTWFITLAATGVTVPDAPINVAATENNSSKVVITWTKSADASGYRVYRDGVDISGLLGDVATFDDTTAAAPVITAGAAVASDGTSNTQVSLSLSGTSIADGTTYDYTVKAANAAGLSAASSANSGYRLASSLTYQWQRSAADSDASYSAIGGATTASYNDTEAPADGSGRYFKCVLDATGSTQATSTSNRGYRKSFIPRIIFM